MNFSTGTLEPHPMNTQIPAPARRPGWRPALFLRPLATLLAGMSVSPLLAPPARAADARPPELMTYQGFLVDANGAPLAPNNPANYPVIFRIFDQATGGNRLWSEQQIVTIDKGNFSVLLGEGTEVSGESRPPLSQVFGGSGLAASASDRYLGITVTINGAPTEILPRLRLLPAPYAYLARHANALVNNVGQPLVAAGTGDNLVVAGSLTANQFLGNGSLLTDLDASKITGGTLNAARIPGLEAGKITSGTLHPDRIPGLDASKITSGTLADARLGANVARRDQVNVFTQNSQFNGHLRVGDIGNFTTTGAGYGKAVVFSGGPDVSPTWNNDNSDPLWIARYNVAENQTQLRINIGDDPGGGGDALVIGTTTGGGADFNQTGTWTPLQEFWVWGIRLRDDHDINRYVDWWRGTGGFTFTMVGANSHNSGTRNVTYDGDANWDFSSDLRLKKDIVEAEPMLERALRVPIRRYRWKDEDVSAKHKLGVIAQEVQPLFPDLVTESPSREGEESHLMVGYSDFGLIAIKALQELKVQQDARLAELQNLARQQQEVINAQARQLAAQQDELARLKSHFASLEQLLRQMAQAPGAARPETASRTVTAEAARN